MTTYNEFKTIKTNQDNLVSDLQNKINSLPKEGNGLVIESIRMTKEYKQLSISLNTEFKKLQNINSFGQKNFKKEIDAERKAKRAAWNR
jgi:hypothetical protein